MLLSQVEALNFSRYVAFDIFGRIPFMDNLVFLFTVVIIQFYII